MVENVAGPLEEMEPRTVQTLQTFRRVLELPLLEARLATNSVTGDDLRPHD